MRLGRARNSTFKTAGGELRSIERVNRSSDALLKPSDPCLGFCSFIYPADGVEGWRQIPNSVVAIMHDRESQEL